VVSSDLDGDARRSGPGADTTRRLVYEDSSSYGYSEPLSPESSEYATIVEESRKEVTPAKTYSYTSSSSTKF